MPKIVQYKLPPGGTVIDLADNNSTALEIEGVDSKDYIVVDTTDGNEILNLSAGGASGQRFQVRPNYVTYAASGSVALLSTGASATTPNVLPNLSDSDTGLGRAAEDQLSLIAGGVEGIRLSESGGAVTVAISGAVSHTGNLEIENASPTLTFDNSTAEDTDGGRESQMDFTGLKTGGGSPAAVTMARVQGSHDGTGDDSKGKISLLTSDGSSLAEAVKVTSAGTIMTGAGGSSSEALGTGTVLLLDNHTGGSNTKCQLDLNTGSGSGNVQVRGFVNSTEIGAFYADTSGVKLKTESGKYIGFNPAGSERFRIHADGKITTNGEASALCKVGGIHLLTGTQTGGTASTDAQDLVIESDSTELGITFLGSTSSRQRIQFGDTANNAMGGISYNHSTNDMQFWNDGSAQSMYFLDEGYLQVNLTTPTAMLAAEGNLITQGAGTIESISTATVTGSGTSFTTVLEAGDAIKFTNDAGGTEIRTVKQINSNTELVLTETPGATGAGRGTKTYFIDPALFSLTTGDAVSKLSAKNSRIGINEADPDYPLHVVGPGGGQDLSSVTGASDGKFTAMFDNSTANGSDRNIVGINTNGAGGSIMSLYRNGTEGASFFSYGTSGSYLDAKNGELHLRTTASHKLDFHTNNTLRMGIDSDGPVWVGSNTTSLSNKEFEVTNGSRFIEFDIQNTTSAMNFGGSGLGSGTKKEMTIGSHAVSCMKFSKYGIAFAKYQLGQINTWNDDQTNGNRTVYLDDSNTDLNVQFQMGNVGMIQLVDNVDKIKLWGLPGFGGVMTFTLRIKQHASAAKTLSYSTIEFSTGAPGGSALSGTTTFNWAGGASHVMSTGNNAIDIVQFTAFCDTTNNVDVYASVIGQNFS